ncbi:MAG: hypothetical protein WBF66_04565 [Dehalococcoidia bacterium]
MTFTPIRSLKLQERLRPFIHCRTFKQDARGVQRIGACGFALDESVRRKFLRDNAVRVFKLED